MKPLMIHCGLRNSVMDEPFSALDANGCSQMYEHLAVYKKRHGLTILEITHNMTDMNRFDYIYYFEDGKAVLEGSHERQP